MSGSIRTRIALAIFGVATAALVLMALAVFVSFRKVLIDNFDDSVRLRATTNLGLVERAGDRLQLRPGAAAAAPGEDGAILLLYGADDAVLAGSGGAALSSRAGRDLLNQALRGREALATLTIDDHRVRALALPVREGGAAGVLVTALPWDQVSEPLDLLSAILLLAAPLTSAVLGAAAFLIARRALRPIHTITRTAQTIAAGDLQQRIEGITSEDEVGELAATFNTMIGRLAATIERERRFTGDASHELRTPLTAMETALDVTLAQERSGEQYREALGALRGQTARMTRMTQQLLLLSRLDADAIPLERRPVCCAELLEALADGFRARHPSVTVDCEAAVGDTTVLADPEMLARAFTNVLENAAHHAGPATTVVTRAGREAEAVVISLTDSGPGFPAGLLGTGFQRFRRGDAARNRGGAGLGLAIVESIVRLHGGSVPVENTAQGARVTFRFPHAASVPQDSH